jgi:hypothetical protein
MFTKIHCLYGTSVEAVFVKSHTSLLKVQLETANNRYLLCFKNIYACRCHKNHSLQLKTMKLLLLFISTILLNGIVSVHSYAFVARKSTIATRTPFTVTGISQPHHLAAPASSTTLRMIDQQVLMATGIAVAGLVSGIGLVVFTEQQGERAKQRGSGLSENMSTRIAGGLLEDMEVSSVEDLGSLTSQLEKALRESGGADEKNLVMTEEEKQRIVEEADDGW